MRIADTCVVVTGGASGIGCALALRFAELGARGVVVADLNADAAVAVADRIGGIGVACDVADPDAIADVVRRAEVAFGPVDIFCSNAGYSDDPAPELTDSTDVFRRIVDVNLLAHVWAAQAVLPAMASRGNGYLLQTISSAALITGPSGPGYTLTKHGALGFAEWVSLNYGDRGIKVSCLCPNAVYTGMFGLAPGDITSEPPQGGSIGEVLRSTDVAAFTIAAMERDEPFLILPHERVRDSFARKADDYDRCLEGTRRRLAKMRAQTTTTND